MKIYMYLVVSLLCFSCSEEIKEVTLNNEDLINSSTAVNINKSVVIKDFKTSFLDTDKTTLLKEVTTDQEFYIKIEYPDNFKRTTFNLHELWLVDNGGRAFQSIMIPYSDFEENNEGMLIKYIIENDENYKLNSNLYKSMYDVENGKMQLKVSLHDSSLGLPCLSDSILFKL